MAKRRMSSLKIRNCNWGHRKVWDELAACECTGDDENIDSGGERSPIGFCCRCLEKAKKI